MTQPKDAKDKAQITAFRKAARELGCDESEEWFQEALRTVGRQKPKGKVVRLQLLPIE
jgi:hypothetical protein